MKELSIEEKAKAYDEAIEKAKECHTDGLSLHQSVKDVIEHIFPELKESEDERIRKGLINYFNDFSLSTFGGLDPKKILAWLEKQGEQKPIIVTKFKVGDVITDNTGVYPHKKVEAIENENYVVRCLYTNCQQYIPINTQDEYILVADKQVKEGCWYLCIKSYHHLGGDDYWFKEGAVYFCEKEGFLRSSKNNNIYVYDCEHWQMYFAPYEQKPVEWNDKDETILKRIIDELKERESVGVLDKSSYDIIEKWLKDLKNKVQPQPKQEWSQEDERERKHCIDFLNHPDMIEVTPTVKRGCIDWLKSLRPQKQCNYNPYKEVVDSIAEMCEKYASLGSDLSDFLCSDFFCNVRVKCKEAKEYDVMFPQTTWEPSDEQMDALKEAVDEHFDIDGGVLWHFISRLKETKEGVSYEHLKKTIL